MEAAPCLQTEDFHKLACVYWEAMRLSICLRVTSNFEVYSLSYRPTPHSYPRPWCWAFQNTIRHRVALQPAATCRNLQPGSWRPKLVTSVLGELVKQPSCRTLATADTAWRLLQALGMGTQTPRSVAGHGERNTLMP